MATVTDFIFSLALLLFAIVGLIVAGAVRDLIRLFVAKGVSRPGVLLRRAAEIIEADPPPDKVLDHDPKT